VARLKASYLWSLASKVCRERDDYTCRQCGINYRWDTGSVDASHHIPRTKGITKYDLQNLATLCRPCHGWLDLHPFHHIDWIKGLLGEDEYEALKARSVGLLKMTDADTRELAATLRGHLKALRARRANGELGVLEI
jgi:hypothetical protein